MSEGTISLSAKKRDVIGKQVRGLRAAGQTPAVMHNHGKDSLHLAVEEAELKKVYANAGKHHPVELNVEGKSYTTLIKEVTNKPASSKLYHSVFQAIKANETTKAEIPLKLVGEIPAEKASLLVLQSIDHVEVEALPKDLVDVIEVDASSLAEVGDRLHISDIKVPHGIEIKSDPEASIALVEMPRDQIAEAEAAAADLAEDAGTPEEASEVPSEQGSDEGGGESKAEISPGGKEQKESHDQGTNPEKH
jgi:large subunit ribosomal protein L25